ncbi:MAG TPA: hypothetical protein DGR79_05045 [Clostridiales bacterium]|nr:hypothetical protein [Clostridiales bacterium]
MHEAWRLFWAKKARGEPRKRGACPSAGRDWHPLYCHLLDVGAVALKLWEEAVESSVRSRVARCLGLDEPTAGRWTALLASLHDLGKAGPVFQARWEEARQRLRKAGLRFLPVTVAVDHGTLTARIVSKHLEAHGFERSFALLLGRAVGGHHGAFPRPDQWCDLGRPQLGDEAWVCARGELFRRLLQAFGLAHQPAPPCPTGQDLSFLLVFLAGLTSVADWIGSAEDYFAFAGPSFDPEDYRQRSFECAGRALAEMGWRGLDPGQPLDFCRVFKFSAPTPVQEAVLSIAPELEGPCLVIIEAPMGQGKTEAALWLQHHLSSREGLRGCYLALPTEATSNQMFGRVGDFLAEAFPGERVNLQLVHGHAALVEPLRRVRLTGVGEDGSEGASVVAEQWFAPKKRALLAPFGVGTVDQALLSVLRVRHGFVRLFALSGKVVLVDEVHAYDTYTSTLVERLLAWLAAMGSPVILLSATLPPGRRRRLLESYLGKEAVGAAESQEGAYPQVTWVSPGRSGSRCFEGGRSMRVEVRRLPNDTNEVARTLLEAVISGGCAVWICNTVGRAQEAYRALTDLLRKGWGRPPGEKPVAGAGDTAAVEVHLLHARFPHGERMAREERVLTAFGKDRTRRPERAILVATQVVEQSLDVDFDLMVTDVAPVDLVLQRAGRLHRHERAERPPGMGRPRLWLVEPGDRDGLPDFGPSARVYDEYILLRSWMALQHLDSITFPDDIARLVREVYEDQAADETAVEGGVVDETLRRHLIETRREMEAQIREDQRQSLQRVVKHPHADRVLDSMDAELEEDDPTVHEAFRAFTRQGMSVEVVCLHEREGRLCLTPNGDVEVDLDRPPGDGLILRLLQASLRVSHPGLVAGLLSQDPPDGWKRCAFLRHHRPLVFRSGKAEVGGWLLTLDPELGLLFERTRR